MKICLIDEKTTDVNKQQTMSIILRKNNNFSWMWIIDKSNKWNLRPVLDIYYSTSSLTRKWIPTIIMTTTMHTHMYVPQYRYQLV